MEVIFTTENATESTLHATDDVPEEDLQDVLLEYLSGLTLKDEDVFTLHLPEKAMPEGFTLIDKRCSKRSEYTNVAGFTIIISNGRIWNKGRKEFREMVLILLYDMYMPCGFPYLKKCQNLLYYGSCLGDS